MRGERHALQDHVRDAARTRSQGLPLMASAAHRAWLFIAVSAVALASTACNSVTSSCSRDKDTVFVPFTPDKLDGDTYHSSPWNGPHQYFPPGRTITFEHGLGR